MDRIDHAIDDDWDDWDDWEDWAPEPAAEEPYFPLRRRFNPANWAVALTCLAWMGGVGWFELGAVPIDRLESHRARAVQEKIHRCEGTFNQRYNCTQNILLTGERNDFVLMLERGLMTFAPPAFGWLIWSTLRRRRNEGTA
jgi:hypothetical protein